MMVDFFFGQSLFAYFWGWWSFANLLGWFGLEETKHFILLIFLVGEICGISWPMFP